MIQFKEEEASRHKITIVVEDVQEEDGTHAMTIDVNVDGKDVGEGEITYDEVFPEEEGSVNIEALPYTKKFLLNALRVL